MIDFFINVLQVDNYQVDTDVWEASQYFQDGGITPVWGSLTVLGLYLMGVGITIRGVVLLAKSFKSDQPGALLSPLLQFVGGLVSFVVIRAVVNSI